MSTFDPTLNNNDVKSLYDGHHQWLNSWLRNQLGCHETAADLAQDTFLRILLKTEPPVVDKPRAYLSTIAKGLMMNHWRRQALEQAYLDILYAQPEITHPSQEEHALVIEALMQLAKTLEGLSPRCRQVFVLGRLEGQSYQQIAAKLNISVNMVQKAMSQAMLNCYRVLYG